MAARGRCGGRRDDPAVTRENVEYKRAAPRSILMSFEEGDAVVLRDEHHEKDGEEGEVVTVSETMFGDQNYTIEVDDERIAGLGEDQLDDA